MKVQIKKVNQKTEVTASRQEVFDDLFEHTIYEGVMFETVRAEEILKVRSISDSTERLQAVEDLAERNLKSRLVELTLTDALNRGSITQERARRIRQISDLESRAQAAFALRHSLEQFYQLAA